MVEHTYRTKGEQIKYFKTLAFLFEKDARDAEKAGDITRMRELLAKADAYENAAFEIEHNADWER